jgi:hypothetical protein
MRVVRLSTLRTGCLYSPGNIPGTLFCSRTRRPQGHSAARRIMSMKNSSDTFENWTHNILPCGTLPQPTVLLRALIKVCFVNIQYFNTLSFQSWKTVSLHLRNFVQNDFVCVCVCVCARAPPLIKNMNLKPQFHSTPELKSYTYINLHFPV